jgi:hypothetical protein
MGTEIAPQEPGPVAAASLAGLVLLTLWQLLRRPPTALAACFALCSAYAFTDLYLVTLHMFLDRRESLDHPLALVRELANHFQQHHGDTSYVFTENHMRDIDALITSLALTTAAWQLGAAWFARQLPRALCLWALAVSLLGELAIYNHSACHARTHGYAIPQWAEAAQDAGLLLSAAFHRVRHAT